MTIDRAMEILNPEHRERYDSIETVNEACRMGMEALKLLKELTAFFEGVTAPDGWSSAEDGP